MIRQPDLQFAQREMALVCLRVHLTQHYWS